MTQTTMELFAQYISDFNPTSRIILDWWDGITQAVFIDEISMKAIKIGLMYEDYGNINSPYLGLYKLSIIKFAPVYAELRESGRFSTNLGLKDYHQNFSDQSIVEDGTVPSEYSGYILATFGRDHRIAT